MSTLTELEQRARYMKNAAPREYNDFCTAFSNYTTAAIDSMISATGDLATFQGRAQQCLKLQRMLEGVKNG